jgi:hypothetical protein
LVLLAKLPLVACLLSLASFNKLRLTPALERRDAGAEATPRRTIEAELAVVVGILIATAALGTTPTPRALTGHVHTPGHHATGEHHAHGLAVERSSGDRHATITFASAHAGPNEVQLVITDQGGAAVQAKEVAFTAANPIAGVEPIRRSAASIRPGSGS